MGNIKTSIEEMQREYDRYKNDTVIQTYLKRMNELLSLITPTMVRHDVGVYTVSFDSPLTSQIDEIKLQLDEYIKSNYPLLFPAPDAN